MTEVLCAGIIVADHICTPISHVPSPGEVVMAERLVLTLGGCAANVAVGLRKMAVRSAVAGRVGDDIFGRIVSTMLSEAGVDVTSLSETPGIDTSQSLIVNVAGQDRRFIHTFGANAKFRAEDIPVKRLAESKILYLGGFFIMPEVDPLALAAVFAQARQSGVKTVLDVVTPGPGDYLSQLRHVLPFTDVFLPNSDEAHLITGEIEPLRQAEKFREMGAGTVVVTCGGSGAVVVSDGVRLRTGVYPVNYVDGTGSGDAFDAGYICGLLAGEDVVGCMKYASALGASCVRAVGTTPGVFTRTECQEFLARNELPIERL